jgi:hypothetical protein
MLATNEDDKINMLIITGVITHFTLDNRHGLRFRFFRPCFSGRLPNAELALRSRAKTKLLENAVEVEWLLSTALSSFTAGELLCLGSKML